MRLEDLIEHLKSLLEEHGNVLTVVSGERDYPMTEDSLLIYENDPYWGETILVVAG